MHGKVIVRMESERKNRKGSDQKNCWEKFAELKSTIISRSVIDN